MYIGKWLLVKDSGQIKKGIVIDFSQEDLKIKLGDDTIINRKYWEVRKIDEKEER